jgi:hypothetical protein
MREKLSKKQSVVLDELFDGDETIEQILQKQNISRALYYRWHSEPAFTDEFERRIEQLNRHSRLLIAKYSSLAAAKLVSLTDSANPETARKACLDIIDRIQKPQETGLNKEGCGRQEDPSGSPDTISPQLAEKILETLAQEKTSDSI